MKRMIVIGFKYDSPNEKKEVCNLIKKYPEGLKLQGVLKYSKKSSLKK